MQTKLCISLRERGTPQIVTFADWERSNSAIVANELARMGVVKVQNAGQFIVVEPKTLVGVFNSPQLRLEVCAKSPQLVNSLLPQLDGWRKFLNVQDSKIEGTNTGIEGIWNTFETLLTRVHQEGLPWEYVRVTKITSTPRGRVNFHETNSKIISKGINHKVAVSQQIRNYLQNFSPALDAVRRRLSSLEFDDYLRRSRVIRLIDLAGDFSVQLNNAEAKGVFNVLSELEGRPALVALCNFCNQILTGEDSIRISRRVGSGVAEFVDMEKLWESAVQLLFTNQHQLQDEQVVLHPLRGSRRTLFDDGGPAIDPDIIFYKGLKALAVIDAKYSIVSSPSAADVYQLASYVSRLKCNIGVLAYVADSYDTSITKIGTLDDGRVLFACYLSVNAFDPAVRSLEGLLLSENF